MNGDVSTVHEAPQKGFVMGPHMHLVLKCMGSDPAYEFGDMLAAFVCRAPRNGILHLQQSRRLPPKLQSMRRPEAQT